MKGKKQTNIYLQHKSFDQFNAFFLNKSYFFLIFFLNGSVNISNNCINDNV